MELVMLIELLRAREAKYITFVLVENGKTQVTLDQFFESADDAAIEAVVTDFLARKVTALDVEIAALDAARAILVARKAAIP